eukprot:c29777_g1_i1 orf=32-466(-)
MRRRTPTVHSQEGITQQCNWPLGQEPRGCRFRLQWTVDVLSWLSCAWRSGRCYSPVAQFSAPSASMAVNASVILNQPVPGQQFTWRDLLHSIHSSCCLCGMISYIPFIELSSLCCIPTPELDFCNCLLPLADVSQSCGMRGLVT